MIKRNITAILLAAVIQICIVLTIYILFLSESFFNKHYKYGIAGERIENEMSKFIDKCGQDYFFSWMVFDGSTFQNKYFFQDVIGCNKLKKGYSCAYSVKSAKLNPFYSRLDLLVDSESLKFFSNIETGSVGYYEDVAILNKYKTIKEAILSSIQKIKSVGFSVVHDERNKLIYVFTITKVESNDNLSCNKHEIVDALHSISIFAKDQI